MAACFEGQQRGGCVCWPGSDLSCHQTSNFKDTGAHKSPSPNRPCHPTVSVMPRCVHCEPLSAPPPPLPPPHILQRRFDQRRESECAPCYLAGSRPWERMIAECDPLAVAPRAQGAGSYCSCRQESRLWWQRGQVFTSSPQSRLSP